MVNRMEFKNKSQEQRFFDSKPIEPESSPLLPKNLFNLLFHPKYFFTKQVGYGQTPYLIFVTICFGILAVIDRIDSQLIKADFRNGSSPTNDLYANIAEHWMAYWIVILIFGILVSAPFIWHIGGWWYTMRIKWSGVKNPDSFNAKLIYVYSSFIISFPTIILTVYYTITYSNYLEAFSADDFLGLIYLVLPFWSLGISYKGVISLFDVKRSKARLWFVIIPSVFYIFAMGIFTYLLAINEI